MKFVRSSSILGTKCGWIMSCSYCEICEISPFVDDVFLEQSVDDVFCVNIVILYCEICPFVFDSWNKVWMDNVVFIYSLCT